MSAQLPDRGHRVQLSMSALALLAHTYSVPVVEVVAAAGRVEASAPDERTAWRRVVAVLEQTASPRRGAPPPADPPAVF